MEKEEDNTKINEEVLKMLEEDSVICENCGEMFIPRPKFPNETLCSKKCSDEWI